MRDNSRYNCLPTTGVDFRSYIPDHGRLKTTSCCSDDQAMCTYNLDGKQYYKHGQPKIRVGRYNGMYTVCMNAFTSEFLTADKSDKCGLHSFACRHQYAVMNTTKFCNTNYTTRVGAADTVRIPLPCFPELIKQRAIGYVSGRTKAESLQSRACNTAIGTS